jgi:cell division protein FtsQ
MGAAATRMKSGRRAPVDVRLMNGVATGILVLALGVVLSAAVWWLVRAPWWAIKAIEVSGDLQRNNVASLRAVALPRLNGTFFSLDLAQARQVFESVAWVRKAVVRRVWPNRLSVLLEEHRPAARWLAFDGNERLVNTYGEVFDGNLGELEGEVLPTLSGPEGTAAQALRMHRQLEALFAALDRRVVLLELSGRGSWSMTLDDDAQIQLGRGEDAQVLARTERFVATVSQVTGNYKAPLLRADLRHSGGYAVRLRGVTMVEAPGGPAGRN